MILLCMDILEIDTTIMSKSKLPLKADWWRETNKINGNDGYNESGIGFLKSPSQDTKIVKQNDGPMERNSTIDMAGSIEISDILFPVHVETEREVYEQNCQRLHCPTSRKFSKTLDNISSGLSSEDVQLAHYGLSNSGLRATAISISNLSQCSTIDIQGNKLSESSLSILISVLKTSSVTEINLSSTGISKFGPNILSKWIRHSQRIKKIFLRDNQFDDHDGQVLFESFTSNRSVVYLDAGENRFSVRCGDGLKKLFDENDVLEVLDLSWNYLRLNAALAIAKGLRKNNGLKRLILSWNGVDDVIAKELGLSLKENDCLQSLELVANRLTDSSLDNLMKGLVKNTALKSLRVGHNTISQKAAEAVLESLKSGDLRNCSLLTLDFTNIIFKSSFQASVDGVKMLRAGFSCAFGYENYYGQRKLKNKNTAEEALKIFRDFIKENNITMEEIFYRNEISSSRSIKGKDFRDGLRDANIDLSDEQVNILIEYLDTDGIGDIALSKLSTKLEQSPTKENSFEQ